MVNIPHKIRAAHHFTTSFRYKKRLQAFGNRNNKRSWLQKKHYCSSIFLSCYEKMLYHIIHVERTLKMYLCICVYIIELLFHFSTMLWLFSEKYSQSILQPRATTIYFYNQMVALSFFCIWYFVSWYFLYLTLSWFPKLHK